MSEAQVRVSGSNMFIPDPFTGKDTITSEMFCSMFQDYVDLSQIEESKAIVMFRRLMKGDAATWVFREKNSMREEEAKRTTLEMWFTKLKKRFPSPNALRMSKKDGETMHTFNFRFAEYTKEIPDKIKTDYLIKKAYYDYIAISERAVAQMLYPKLDSLSLQELMDQAAGPIDATSDVNDLLPEQVITFESTTRSTAAQDVSKQLEEITKQIDSLQLAVKGQRSRLQVTCFNCGDSGHISTSCSKPQDVEAQKKRRDAVNKSKAEQSSSPNQLLVLHVEEPPTKRKRIEVSDLLNPPEVIKVEKIKPKTKAKKPKKPTLMLHDISEKLLDCVVNLTWKDLMTVQPRLITPLVKQMRSTSKKKKLQLLGKDSDDELTDEHTDEETSGDDTSESSTDETDYEDPMVQDVVQKGELPARYTELKPASYLKVRIGKHECGLFLDTGAHYLIVSQSFLGRIGAVPTLLEQSKKICPIDKSSLIIRKCCTMNIEFAPGVVIPITFLVMDNSAVPLLLGIIDFLHIEGSISYSNSEVTIRLKSKQVTLPLYEKRELDEVLSEEEDDDDIIASVLKEFVSDNADEDDDVSLSQQETSEIEYQEKKLQMIKDRITEIDTLEDNERKKVRELLIRFEDVFEERIERLSGLKNYFYEILLEPDAKPIASKCRKFSPKEKVIIPEELTKMKQAGIVKESESEWVSPVVLVPKPDGSIRFCINFKVLNKVTPKDKYPLPLIDDCVQQLSGKPFVSFFDCASGYWQVKLHPTSTKYTALITPFGTYEFTVLPFGLTNAPAMFSRLMENMFKDFRGHFMAIYLDDLAVFLSSFEENLDHLEQVFKRLREHQVMLKLKKCRFVAQGFRYLGFMITPQGLQPDPRKVEALVKLKMPKNVHQLRSFLGLAGYFRRFIPVFARKAVPLTALLRKDAEFIWTPECKAAVEYFKNALVTAPVLKQVDEKNALVLSCDASGTALGSVLEQFDEEGVLRPVAYYSRRFLKAECNYISYERECLAVVSSIQHFRYLLHGRSFTVYTDNSAVTDISRARDPVGRIARWIYILSEYDFDLKHRAGKENHVADALSRLPVVAVAVAENQSPGPITFYAVVRYLTGENSLDSTRMRREARKYAIDSSGSLFRRTKLGNLKVLNTTGEVHDVLRILHDQLGHFGFTSVWDWVRERFWARSLYRDVKQLISSCVECQSYSFRRPLYQFTGQSKIILGLGT
ncbi:hypothetical protein MP638_006620 [Amoeboaphelidium occidentale]|nr:hypothetical protein MP638_006620 [Amoeboaphelidium occidentale]